MLWHVLGWAALGGVAGFIYGWRRLRESHERSRAIIDSVPFANRVDRAYAIGQQRGYRLAAGTMGAALGAVAGLVIGLATGIFAKLADVQIW
jgi:hypothetical protein